MSDNAYSFIVCLPGEKPVRHDLGADAISFGRSPDNDIQILVAELSKKHGQLVKDNDSYRVIDSGSTNGTQVNGQAVGSEGVVLSPKARLVLGTIVPAYFVPASELEGRSLEEVVSSLESAAPPATPKTAPVAVAAAGGAPAPVRAAIPVAAPATPAGATVKLDQVRGPAPVPVKPVAVPPQAPGAAPVAPVAPGTTPQPLRPPGAAPGVAPVPVKPVAAPPAAAPAPVKPGVPQPLRPPGVAPAPVAPSAPTIPLPKTPPKPGE